MRIVNGKMNKTEEGVKCEMKRTNGITLIALIITIIVLLILAGVALATLTGQGNIIGNAENAVGKYNNSVSSEQQLLNEIEKYFQNYLEGENVEEDKGVPVDKTEIANNPEEHFGGYVDYTTPNGDPDVKWRIFYADEENVYLIADSFIPSGANDSMFGNYRFWLQSVDTGIIDPRITKWLSYLIDYPDSTNSNIKKVAWLLDTTVWEGYANSTYAEYAVGAPTLDLFCASYNKLHTDKQINYYPCEELYKWDPMGYNLKWSTDTDYVIDENGISGLDITNNLYATSGDKVSAMWLASPGNYLAGEYLIAVSSDGSIYFQEGSSYVCGLRPVVCLKSDVQITKKSDGTYTLSLPE